eukprot:312701_1
MAPLPQSDLSQLVLKCKSDFTYAIYWEKYFINERKLDFMRHYVDINSIHGISRSVLNSFDTGYQNGYVSAQTPTLLHNHSFLNPLQPTKIWEI